MIINVPEEIKIFSTLAMLCGIYNLILGFASNFLFFIFLAVILLILSISFLVLWKIARIIAILFSCLFILFYLILIIALIRSGDSSWSIGLVFYFPTFAWSLFCIKKCLKNYR